MSRSLLERRLSEVASRLTELRRDLAVADEQLAVLDDMADDARLRSLVSETPLAGQDMRSTQRHADAMRRHRADLAAEISELERSQDDLLDRMFG
jgi:chromosome segregation ATPase